jgi:hypothetical protein
LHRTAAALTTVAIACSGGSSSDSGTEPVGFQCAPALEFGDGLTTQTCDSYTPLADGDTVELTHGPQGGDHVWFGAHVTGPGPELVTRGKVFDLRTDTQVGGTTAASVLYLSMPDFDGCDGTFTGGRAVLDALTTAEVCDLDGAPLRLEIEVQDFDGTYSYSGVGRSAFPTAIQPDATASVEVVATLSDYLRDCFCGATTGDTGYCYN